MKQGTYTKDPPRTVLAGGAGLVGQTLVDRMLASGPAEIIVIDKDVARLRELRQRHPGVTTITADLSKPGDWTDYFDGATAAVMLQAQISSRYRADFERNNLTSTRRVLAALQKHRVPYTVHVSSSVVCSVAEDPYAQTKREQEAMFLGSGLPGVVLRPTLLFGRHDSHHLGWLARFMRYSPVFPIPGDGLYLRQPLFVQDFCSVIEHCLERRSELGCINLTGLEPIAYIDLVRYLRRITQARSLLLPIPISLFGALLETYGFLTRRPPFTRNQLQALIAGDHFEVIDWPARFEIEPTPLHQALEQTFGKTRHSSG
ncbi:NAD(P)-dependent oxidoreductase [Thioalkalivibrio sp. ALMg13-2]|uniref:NAD-dependent epimerase/dehydratase family protein n=1 Tax=Thioalkalivibrio sp. ALMg13-2 TaxID=1158167 RepID=UPI000366EEF6|nr:NAD(P)-dependent oxidoreductase [Thioalkalivibrio sp. ALMg13-2]